MSSSISDLEHFFQLKEKGIITQKEFDQKKTEILGQNSSPAKTNFTPQNGTDISLDEGIEIGPVDRKFRLVREIGGGAMGCVWQARDLAEEAAFDNKHHTYKALKVVAPALMHSPRAVSNLKKEAIRASKLSHPNIININGWHIGTEGWLFVEMEYLEGRDLDGYLEEQDNKLSWQQSLPILTALASGLDHAHNPPHQLIHRDLKPGNIFITSNNEVKILDFGLAYQLRKSFSQVNTKEIDNSGTAEYMPPEAFIAGEPDKKQDVYALACLIYEMLTGEPPYSKEKSVERATDLFPQKPNELNDSTWQLLKLGLAYDKKDRINSALELINRMRDSMEEAIEAEKVPQPVQGKHINLKTSVSESLATQGGDLLIKHKGKQWNLNIPAGTKSGDQLRLPEQGDKGSYGGSAGDLVIDIFVAVKEVISELEQEPTHNEIEDANKPKINIDDSKLKSESKSESIEEKKSILKSISNLIHTILITISATLIYIETFIFLPALIFNDKSTTDRGIESLILPSFLIGFYFFLTKYQSKLSKESLLHKFIPTKIIPLAVLLAFIWIVKN